MSDNDLLLMQLGNISLAQWVMLIFLSVPPLLVLYSRRVRGRRKVLWFVLTSVFSWLAYIPFLIMTKHGAALDGPAKDA